MKEKKMYMWPSNWSRPVAYGDAGAISSNSSYATKAGLEILKQGGNAFDAAVTVSLVLSVVEPHHSGIGGGCFSLIYNGKEKKFYSIDGRGVAPRLAYKNLFLKNGVIQDEWKDLGGQSVVVPSLLKTLEVILKKFGTMKFSEVAEPAIKLANEGFGLSYTGSITMFDDSVTRKLNLSKSMRKLYCKDNGSFYKFGEIQTNKDIANLLKNVSNFGIDYFYNGKIADKIVKSINERGGCFTIEDLSEYQPKFREPLKSKYRDCEVVAFPPPSGGCTLIEMLNILEKINLKDLGHNSAEYIHILAETIKLGFADRSAVMGDPDFVEVDVTRLISKKFAEERFNLIGDSALDYSVNENILEDYPGNTSHFSVIDSQGNSISQTQTIRDWFGCGIVVDGLGFVLNNAMSDFSAGEDDLTSQGLVYGDANIIEGGKTPLSSMAPSVVLRDGEPFLVIGAAGGPRIITGTLQGILNAVDFGMTPERLVNLPYIHTITNKQGLEIEYGVSEDTLNILKGMGYNLIINSVNNSMSTMLNSVMKKENNYYAAGTSRVDGCGGTLLSNGNVILEGITHEKI